MARAEDVLRGSSRSRALPRLWTHLPVQLATYAATGLTAGVLALFIFSLVRFGSAGAFVSILRREPLHVEPVRFDIGAVDHYARLDMDLVVCNLTARAFAVNGMTLVCSNGGCFTRSGLEPLPITVPPYSRRAVPVQFVTPAVGRGPFESGTTLFTEYGTREIRVVGLLGSTARPAPVAGGRTP